MKSRDAFQPKPRVECKLLDMHSEQTFLDVQSFEGSLGIQRAPSREKFDKAVGEGGLMAIAIYDGDRIVGMSYLRSRAHPSGSTPMLRNFPNESVLTFGTAVVPDARGKGLQKLLLEKRIEVAQSMGKETLIGSFYGENGASARTVFSVGGRALLYEDDNFRLIFEIDTTVLNNDEEEIDVKDAMTPDAALKALERGDERIVVWVKSLGRDGVDEEARKAIREILTRDYVGTAIETLGTDADGVRINGLLFRHLSTFPPEIEKRLRERREKIKSLL